MTVVQDRTRKRVSGLFVWKAISVLALASGAAAAQTAPPAPSAAVPPGQSAMPLVPQAPPAPGERPPAPPADIAQQSAVALSGSVAGYNYGPRGNEESLLVQSDGKLLQANFPPDVGELVANIAHMGDKVQMMAIPALGMPDHGIYEMVSLTPGDGQPITIAGPGIWHVRHVDGVLKSLNYGRHGEVNGAMLDSGDFVHLDPGGENLIHLSLGQKLRVDGYARAMVTGHDVIEADSVNGQVVRAALPPARRAALGGPVGPGPRDRGPRPGDATPPSSPAL